MGNDGEGREAGSGQLVSPLNRTQEYARRADPCLSLHRRKFEIEKLNVEDIEMEDLNFYYANYSRYVGCYISVSVMLILRLDITEYITTSLHCERAPRSCRSLLVFCHEVC